jgi:hypothetical protein
LLLVTPWPQKQWKQVNLPISLQKIWHEVGSRVVQSSRCNYISQASGMDCQNTFHHESNPTISGV